MHCSNYLGFPFDIARITAHKPTQVGFLSNGWQFVPVQMVTIHIREGSNVRLNKSSYWATAVLTGLDEVWEYAGWTFHFITNVKCTLVQERIVI